MLNASTLRRVAGLAAVTTTTLAVSLAGASIATGAAPSATPAALSDTSEGSATTEAKRLGRPVEVKSETTTTSLVVANPDGTFTLTSHREPVRVRRDSGWVPVDTTLRVQADGSIAPVATDQPIVFSGGGSTPMVTIGAAGKSLSLRWPAALPTPILSGSSATYPNVLPGVDLVVNAQAESFSQVLVVKDATAAANPALTELTLTAEADALQLTSEADGSMTATDAAGAKVFVGPPPTMWDSHLDQRVGAKPSPRDPGSGRVNPVAARLTQSATAKSDPSRRQYAIALTPPGAALQGPDVTYPLFVDPGFTGARINFAVVRSAGSTLFNTTDPLKTGYCGWAGCNGTGTYRSYFSLNVSPISGRATTAEIYSARLNILATHNAHGCTGEVVRLYSANSISAGTDWPGPAVTHLATSGAFNYGGGDACPANWVRWSGTYLTDKIQQAANGDWNDITFGLLPNTGDAYEWKKFANNPNIDITYAFPPSQATSLAITSPIDCNGLVRTTSKQPVLNAKAYDYNPSPLTLRHHFHVYKADGTWIASGTKDAGTGATAQWVVDTPLNDGSYYFRVNVESLAGLNPNQITWGTAQSAFTVQNGSITTPPSPTSFDYPKSSELEAFWGAPAGQGKIDITANGAPDVVGFAYSWTDASGIQAIPTSKCAYTSTFLTGGVSGGGWISATAGKASILVPSDLPSGPRTLHVKSFNDAHSMSGVSSYPFMIAPAIAGKPATKLEMETLAANGAVTQSAGQNVTTYKEGPNTNYWSSSYQQHFITSGAGQKFDIAFTAPASGNYALGAAITQANHFGILRFAIDGEPLNTLNPETEQNDLPIQFDGYHSTSRAGYANLGDKTFTAGNHTLTVEVIGKHPASINYIDKGISDNGYAFGLDYLRITPVS